jgi:hypothetical protein
MSNIVYLEKDTKIEKNNISVKIVLDKDNLDEKIYFEKIQKTLETLNSNLPAIHREIIPWNSGLEDFITQLLEKRKQINLKKIDFMEKIGLNVNPKSSNYLIPPVIRGC